MVSRKVVTSLAGAGILVAATVVVLAYGPSRTPVAPAGTADDRELAPVTYELTECQAGEFVAKLAASTVEDRVPPELEVETDPMGLATVVLNGFHCAGGKLGGEVLEATGRVFTLVIVEPQEPALEGEDVANYYYALELHTLDDAFGAALSEFAPSTKFAERVEASVSPTGVHLWAEVETGTTHVYAPLGPPTPVGVIREGIHFRVFLPSEGGLAYVDGVVELGLGAGAGPGTVETAPGTAARELFGASAQGLSYYASAASVNAEIGFIGQGPGST